MKLPVISGSQAVQAFEKIGYQFDEQHGSHIVLRRASHPINVFLSQLTRNSRKELCEL